MRDEELDLVLYPDPILRKKAAPLRVIDDVVRDRAAQMIDVSVIGIGLIVDAQTTLSEKAQLTVSFALPEHDSAMQFEGVVRNRRPQGDSVRYGMEFVGRESDRRFTAQQKVISDYVMRRQRQMLRERKDESDA